MADKFDIIEYLSGLTGFVFDKAVLKRIALDRGVYGVQCFSELTQQDKDLMRADLLLVAYLSPNVWASSTHAHGSFSETIGSQTVYTEDKERIYNQFINIYKKYDDEKLTEVEDLGGDLQWLDY
jgi:hypothetical protein